MVIVLLDYENRLVMNIGVFVTPSPPFPLGNTMPKCDSLLVKQMWQVSVQFSEEK